MDISAVYLVIFIKISQNQVHEFFFQKQTRKKKIQNSKLIFMSMLIKNEAHVNLRNASHSDRQRWKRIYIVDWTKIHICLTKLNCAYFKS